MKINKIIGALGNMSQIMEGVKNKVFKNEDVEEIARLRWIDCAACPHLDDLGDKCAVKATKPCCGKCGCSLGLKLRALSSSCPIGKWNAVTDPKGESAIKKQIKEEENASNI
tara:strand:- start:861 stop:1196 length:336 start_codon:yes stop_codon:yes gene_type:complete